MSRKKRRPEDRLSDPSNERLVWINIKTGEARPFWQGHREDTVLIGEAVKSRLGVSGSAGGCNPPGGGSSPSVDTSSVVE